MNTSLIKILLLCFALTTLCSCASKTPPDKSGTIVSMQIIDRNGFTETISNADRLSSYQTTNFLSPQPYRKVLRVFGRNADGQSTSKISSYHENGHLWQYLEVVDGRAHGMYREWFPNGQVKIEAPLIEGVADIHDLAQSTWVFEGICKVWDDQGHLIAEYNYSKGLLQDLARYFFPSGTLQKSIPYIQGEIHGTMRVFDENGFVIEEISYVKGEKEGHAIAYWTPDVVLSKEFYRHDLLLSASYYNATGLCIAEIKEGKGKKAQFKDNNLSSLITFSNGVPEGEVQLFYPNGTLHCSYTLKEGKKNGDEWEYYPSEEGSLKPKLCVHWNEDSLQGQVKTWYPNGQKESQREINGNKKQGVSFAWYKNGDLMLTEEYENDLLVKGSYFKKADKQAVSKIDSGKGVASFYSSDGIFLKKVSYEKGRPQLTDGTFN